MSERKIEVGTELVRVRKTEYRQSEPVDVVVTKVGRKWFDYALPGEYGRAGRATIKDLAVDDEMDYRATLYWSRGDYEAAQTLDESRKIIAAVSPWTWKKLNQDQCDRVLAVLKEKETDNE